MSIAATQIAAPQTATRGFLGLRMALGLFLLVTAGLKVHGLALDPLAGDSFLASPRLQIAAIEVEVLLGLWLLSGWQQRAARYAAITFFSIVAAASLYMAFEGQAHCGCLGPVELSPWWTLGLDGAIVLVLAAVRPLPFVANALPVHCLLRIAAGGVLILAVAAGTFFLAFDNPSAALAYLRGEPISVEPAVVDVNEGRAGETRAFTVSLTNHLDREVSIIGGTTARWCDVTADLPMTVAPGSSCAITIHVRFTGAPGRFIHRFGLYTDADEQPVVTARFAGRVLPKASQ